MHYYALDPTCVWGVGKVRSGGEEGGGKCGGKAGGGKRRGDREKD